MGYAIGLQSGLLEQKHFDAMGQAVWLYMWLIDKQVKGSDQVLGGKPINYARFSEDFPHISDKTYRLWMKALEHGGYVSTERKQRGLAVTILKPKKWHSDRSNITEQETPDRSNITAQDRQEITDQKVVTGKIFPPDRQEITDAYNVEKQRETNIEKQAGPTNLQKKNDAKRQLTAEVTEFLGVYNETYRTNFKSVPPLLDNYAYWRAMYSQEDILKAARLSKKHEFWATRITPIIMLRRKGPGGEAVDRIGEFLALYKPPAQPPPWQAPEPEQRPMTPEQRKRIAEQAEEVRARLRGIADSKTMNPNQRKEANGQ